MPADSAETVAEQYVRTYDEATARSSSRLHPGLDPLDTPCSKQCQNDHQEEAGTNECCADCSAGHGRSAQCVMKYALRDVHSIARDSSTGRMTRVIPACYRQGVPARACASANN